MHRPQKHISQCYIYWKPGLGLCAPIPVCFHFYFGVPLPASFFPHLLWLLLESHHPEGRRKHEIYKASGSLVTKVLSCTFYLLTFFKYINTSHLHLVWFFCSSDPPFGADWMLCFWPPTEVQFCWHLFKKNGELALTWRGNGFKSVQFEIPNYMHPQAESSCTKHHDLFTDLAVH